VRLRDFYADPARAASDEIEFGASWRTQGTGPWKVLWVRDTGELAAFNEGARTTVPTGRLGVRAMLGGGTEDEVVVLGVDTDLERVRDALTGWREHMAGDNGLAWLAERAATFPGATGVTGATGAPTTEADADDTWDDAQDGDRESELWPGPDRGD
jgi:hypothetical protein